MKTATTTSSSTTTAKKSMAAAVAATAPRRASSMEKTPPGVSNKGKQSPKAALTISPVESLKTQSKQGGLVQQKLTTLKNKSGGPAGSKVPKPKTQPQRSQTSIDSAEDKGKKEQEVDKEEEVQEIKEPESIPEEETSKEEGLVEPTQPEGDAVEPQPGRGPLVSPQDGESHKEASTLSTIQEADQEGEPEANSKGNPRCLGPSVTYNEGRKLMNKINEVVRSSSKFPEYKRKEIEETLEELTTLMLKLELEAIAANAREEAIRETLKHFEVTEDRPSGSGSKAEPVGGGGNTAKKTYAEVATKAATTIIIQPDTEDDKELQEIQATITTMDVQDMDITRVQRTRKGGFVATCHTHTGAEKLSTYIQKQHSLQNKVKVTRPGIKKSKVIIYHTSQQIQAPQIRRSVARASGIHTQTEEQLSSLVVVSSPIAAGANTVHWPVEMPAYAADELIRAGTVCVGFKQCRVKPFISVVRCYRCQGFDHTAGACRNHTTCAHCGGRHDTKECKETKHNCINCTEYNSKRKRKVPADHPAYSRSCPVYRMLLADRQAGKNISSFELLTNFSRTALLHLTKGASLYNSPFILTNYPGRGTNTALLPTPTN